MKAAGATTVTRDGGEDFLFWGFFNSTNDSAPSGTRLFADGDGGQRSDGGSWVAAFPQLPSQLHAGVVVAAPLSPNLFSAYIEVTAPPRLMVQGAAVDRLDAPSAPLVAAAEVDQYSFFAASPCGSNCVALAGFEGSQTDPTLFFFSNEVSPRLRGAFSLKNSMGFAGQIAVSVFGNRECW